MCLKELLSLKAATGKQTECLAHFFVQDANGESAMRLYPL
jgi:hypothetical protein